MAYALARTGRLNHLPINIGIRGAYAIRPYPTGRKMDEERAACGTANPILDGDRIHAEKMNHVLIKEGYRPRRRNKKKAEEESLPRPLRALIGEIRKL